MSSPTYDREPLIAEICERLAEGDPLRVICRDVHMPAWRTVYLWIASSKDIDARIAQARATGFDAIAEHCLEIADDTSQDTIATEQGERPNTEWMARSKLRIETRLKLLAKWDPKRYGDLQKVEHSGSVDVAATLIAARKRSGIS